ncbi:MAG: hypothetical protein ABI947_00935 [Chloroflexota bacterium]
MNIGGWLLLSFLLGGLLLLVQRAEIKRRTATLTILAFVGFIVWRYAIYRMSGDCYETVFRAVCNTPWTRQWASVIATNTINWAIVTALIGNALFWILIGRSNPPGTSDSIQVFGAND